VYNYIGLGLNFEIRGNGIRWNETKHVELEQFLHAFTSRGFNSVSWAFLLRLGAPVFCQPLMRLFNLSIAASSVPKQWKQAIICPVAKVAAPKSAADYRPISVTPILTRMMEGTVVQRFLYPAFQSPPSTLTFMDQFDFRPTGSMPQLLLFISYTLWPPCLPVTHTSYLYL